MPRNLFFIFCPGIRAFVHKRTSGDSPNVNYCRLKVGVTWHSKGVCVGECVRVRACAWVSGHMSVCVSEWTRVCVCVCVCVREREREQERFCVKAELCDRQMSLNGTKTNTATKHNWASHTLVSLSLSSLSFSLFFLFLFGCSEFFLSILFNKALLSFFQQISL